MPVAIDELQQREYNVIRTADRPVFARLSQLRQLLERVTVPVVMEPLAELDPEDKAILLCELRETVATLQSLCEAADFGCVMLAGIDSSTRRQKAIDRFQQNADCRVFGGTTSAVGTDHNLTAANYMFAQACSGRLVCKTKPKTTPPQWPGVPSLVVVKIPLVENSMICNCGRYR